MKLYLIRHGQTEGNRQHRYVGRTDEGLTPEAVRLCQSLQDRMPEAAAVYTSPMKRCLETAGLLCPGHTPLVVEDFSECDFGEFEYRNYAELNGNPAYQRFIDTLGRSGFPGGEDRETFQRRCVRGFEGLIPLWEEKGWLSRTGETEPVVILILHGGTIMALLDIFAEPHRDYYDWQAPNGGGYLAVLDREDGTGRIRLTDVEPIDFALRQSGPAENRGGQET